MNECFNGIKGLTEKGLIPRLKAPLEACTNIEKIVAEMAASWLENIDADLIVSEQEAGEIPKKDYKENDKIQSFNRVTCITKGIVQCIPILIVITDVDRAGGHVHLDLDRGHASRTSHYRAL
jgi:hypothetical protein